MDIWEKKYTVQYFKVWKEGFIESLIQNVMKKFYASLKRQYKQFTDNSKKKCTCIHIS